MAVRGYARVSTEGQTTDPQVHALRAAGVDVVAVETVSGSVPAARRPVLAGLLEDLAQGDSLAVARLDRLGRDPADVLAVLRDLDARGIGVRILDLGADTTSPAGRLVVGVLSIVAGWERDILRDRTRAGLAAARRRGARIGRPPSLAPAQVQEARRMMADGRSASEVARLFRTSRASLYRALDRTPAPS